MDQSNKHQTRTVAAGVIGNVLEWYDFGLFGFFAPVISQLFFPHEDDIASLLQTFGIFALGYFMRPVGGFIFGHIGDRIGRKKALELSVLLMALPTTCIGLLPTYHASGAYPGIGLWAALLLTLIRVLQGISVGGEYIGSIAFLGEHASAARRGFLGSWTNVSAGLGMLIGSGVAALTIGVLPEGDLNSWGWRVPFLFGILVGGVGLWLRHGIEESPRFQEAQQSGDVAASPVSEALRRDFRGIAEVFGVSILGSVGFYMPFVWLSTWLSEINKPELDHAHALGANTLALAFALCLTPLAGALSDRIGRRPVLLFGAIAFALFSYPLFLWLQQGTFFTALTGQLVFAVFMALMSGAAPATFVEQFPTRTRYSGIAVGYNAAQALFGGTSPAVATWLCEVTGDVRAPAIYLVGVAVVSGLVMLVLRERARQPLT
jgi:MHS family proline/betaine transporter-like MFS transporter